MSFPPESHCMCWDLPCSQSVRKCSPISVSWRIYLVPILLVLFAVHFFFLKKIETLYQVRVFFSIPLVFKVGLV